MKPKQYAGLLLMIHYILYYGMKNLSNFRLENNMKNDKYKSITNIYIKTYLYFQIILIFITFDKN